ncbi:thiol:disulfide interchange protein DsbA/DsbL [Massilia litorea]|jgi:thiol:disulfide interchange protein DsbA|uniref:Thiol:disulfide interchange protein n=1 Tax=Massilia litorea TaxID=2769491 RepID=A0A7L9U5A7_9BURK|nr:thiol:disulfide interchange protein DsbA/DsbL [Massilia litorea]QOL49589.1 thiol:disulfide interchange protein DsbA/DsbL [Massilia litorea]
MRRSLRFALVAASLVASTAFASPTNPQNGVEYTTLSSPQPVQAVGKKVEVIEFFAYHCPACYALEASMVDWAKKNADKVNFRRIHLPFQGVADPEAHLFLTLEAMGKEAELHPKILNAVHVQRIRLMKDDQIIDWVTKNGVDKAKFMETWNSFGVMTKLRRLGQTATSYQVSGTPTLIVDGKYQTSPGQVAEKLKINDRNQMLQASFQVLDALVAKAAATK